MRKEAAYKPVMTSSGQTSDKLFALSAAVKARHVALPAEHGSWLFLFTPLLIGLVTGGVRPTSLLLILAALAGFLIRQPITMAVKVYAKRRTKREIPAIAFWLTIYSLVGLAAVIALVALGDGFLLWLAVPALLVFAWHLWLVQRRAERRQLWLEITAGAVLALAAPAAYWVGKGQISGTGWLLWGLSWLQVAGTILYAYLRLDQRALKRFPTRQETLLMARPAFLYHLAVVLLVAALALGQVVPQLLPLAYIIQLVEVAWGMMHPAVGVKPKMIGFRQLAISLIFTFSFITLWILK